MSHVREVAKQLTVRGVPEELSERLKRLSEERGESVNATLLALLKQAVGMDERAQRLGRYATWQAEDAQTFERALDAQRIVDESQWTDE